MMLATNCLGSSAVAGDSFRAVEAMPDTQETTVESSPPAIGAAGYTGVSVSRRTVAATLKRHATSVPNKGAVVSVASRTVRF